MNANEIRVGNWFYYHDQDLPFKWYASDFEHVETTQARPIPLTPEILEKAGFNDFYTISIFDAYKNDVIICYDNQEKVFAIGGNWYKAEYLHQLQNLYFALTGEELNIEL